MKRKKPSKLEYLFFKNLLTAELSDSRRNDISGIYYGPRYAARDATDILCPFYSIKTLREMSRNLSEILKAFYKFNYGIRWNILTQAEYLLGFLKTKDGATLVREFQEVYKMDNPVEVILGLQVFLDYELWIALEKSDLRTVKIESCEMGNILTKEVSIDDVRGELIFNIVRVWSFIDEGLDVLEKTTRFSSNAEQKGAWLRRRVEAICMRDFKGEKGDKTYQQIAAEVSQEISESLQTRSPAQWMRLSERAETHKHLKDAIDGAGKRIKVPDVDREIYDSVYNLVSRLSFWRSIQRKNRNASIAKSSV